MRRTCIPLAALAALSIARLANAQEVPDLINYQGTLLLPNGTPEPGPKTLEFRIVDEGSAVVWGPQTFEELPLQNGKFNVLLGQADNDGPFVSTAFAGDGDAARYLSVKVAGEPAERLPLQRIASVPFAMRAEMADGVAAGSITDDSIATGAITKEKLPAATVYTARIQGAPANFDMLRTLPINVRSNIPGLTLAMPVSGVGRPVRAGLRRAKGFTDMAGDIQWDWINCGMKGEFGITLVETSDLYTTGFHVNGPSGLNRDFMSFEDVSFIVDIPSGQTTATFQMSVLFNNNECLYEFFISGGAELYAFEM